VSNFQSGSPLLFLSWLLPNFYSFSGRVLEVPSNFGSNGFLFSFFLNRSSFPLTLLSLFPCLVRVFPFECPKLNPRQMASSPNRFLSLSPFFKPSCLVRRQLLKLPRSSFFFVHTPPQNNPHPASLPLRVPPILTPWLLSSVVGSFRRVSTFHVASFAERLAE